MKLGTLPQARVERGAFGAKHTLGETLGCPTGPDTGRIRRLANKDASAAGADLLYAEEAGSLPL